MWVKPAKISIYILRRQVGRRRGRETKEGKFKLKTRKLMLNL
jgi:hypothetical protein